MLKLLLISLLATTTLLWLPTTLPSRPALAAECGTTQDTGQPSTGWGDPEQLQQDPACLSDPAHAKTLIGPMLNWGLTLLMIGAALSAFIMLIWGAYKYISAQGDASKAAEGRQTIQYAVVGLIILAVVYLGVVFYNTLLSGSAGS